MSLSVEIVLIKLTNGNNKKVDCIECKPPSHLYFFPGPIKFKQLREAWIKKVRRETLTKKDLGNQLQAIESVPSILLMDWKLIKIPYQPFFLIMKIKKKKNQEEHYLESCLEIKVRAGYITPATSISQEEEELPLQGNFIDKNLDINLEELNEPM